MRGRNGGREGVVAISNRRRDAENVQRPTSNAQRRNQIEAIEGLRIKRRDGIVASAEGKRDRIDIGLHHRCDRRRM
jgi:hypothetical protein